MIGPLILLTMVLCISTSLSFGLRSFVARSGRPCHNPSRRYPLLPRTFQPPAHRAIQIQLFSTQDDILHNDKEEEEDTIYALSSGSGGVSAIAVIRCSGPQSLPILQSLCQATKTTTTAFQPRQVHLRKLYHPITRVMLDHAVVVYWAAPHSYTGQDCVEIQCHGGRAVVAGLLQALADAGARGAEPGEFTQRAFGAGKLRSLTQVEALADLLAADTSAQREQALRQFDVHRVYTDWRQQLIACLAHAEAIIDFGDDERLDDAVMLNEEGDRNSSQQQQLQQDRIWGRVVGQVSDLMLQMQRQLSNERRGEMVREGVKIAIFGPPNVGKSSLLNLLAARDAAIVSPIAGTTRDIVEVPCNLQGIKCLLQDTAGVRAASEADAIEQLGIERSLRAAQHADLILAVVDATDRHNGWTMIQQLWHQLRHPEVTTSSEDAAVGRTVRTRPASLQDILLVINKSDLSPSSDNNFFEKHSPSVSLDDNDDLSALRSQAVEISCATQQGLDALLDRLGQRVRERVFTSDHDDHEPVLIARTRHRQHVQAAYEALERFGALSQQGSWGVDLAAEELRRAATELGRITGTVDVEDVLDRLFADFCIGK
jgi:tRNA modification GTPase